MSDRSLSKSNSDVSVDVLLREKKKKHSNVVPVQVCRFYAQASDLRRFQMMIRVPVFPREAEMMTSNSTRSSSSVLKGEYRRMSCRLALCISLTEGEVEVKDESSRVFQ